MQSLLGTSDATKRIFFKAYTNKELAKYVTDNVEAMQKKYFKTVEAKYLLAELHRSREHLLDMAAIVHDCLNGELPAHLPKEPKHKIPLL